MVLAALLWLLALELVGLATLPLAHRIFSGMPDRGYGCAKFLGLTLIAYVTWSTGLLGLTAFSGFTIAAFAVILGVWSWWRWGGRVVAGWRESRRLAIGAEATFLIVFAGGAWIRSYSPAIAGQEKQMDFTFLNSLISTTTLPAPDLWLAGFGMPYYYFGYLTQSLVAKVIPVEAAVAYNLAVVSVLALTAVGAFGVVASLIRLAGAGHWMAIGAGGVAAFALAVMGNLEAFFELIASWKLGDQAFWTALGIKNLTAPTSSFPPTDGIWWFKAARVIPNIQPDGITEFPYFSFLLGDLHPHYMAIPLGLLVVALAAQSLAAPASFGSDWVRLGVSAIALAGVVISNTWDVPVFWGLFGMAFLAGVLAGDIGLRRALLERLGRLAMVFGGAVLLCVPYAPGYMSQPLAIGVTEERTMFGSLFVLFGPLLVLTAVAGAVSAYRLWRVDEGDVLPSWAPLGGVVVGILVGIALREPTLGFLVGALGLWLPLAWARVRLGAPPAAAMAALLVVAGLGSILVPELLFIKDVFGSRMNTVFKFYYDAWILLALAAPLLGWELLQIAVPTLGTNVASLGRRSSADPATPTPDRGVPIWLRAAAGASVAVAAVLAAAGAFYPVFATHTKSGGFAAQATLDGMVHLRATHPDDVAVIAWLKETEPGKPLVEAVGGSYTDAGRFATFGASPALLGWAGHEGQWRGPTPEIGRRETLARRVYTDNDVASWIGELQQLGIRFIVVGDMERQIYRLDRPALEDVLPLVHRSRGTAIYRVPPGPGSVES